MADYIPTIGIECHIQLKTKTKLFAAVGNDARGAEPNSLISHICVGMPGALPVLNEAALELASRAAFALNTEPAKFSMFERKHYFYPDLPKGYQITQMDHCIIMDGHVDINVDGQTKRVNINRANLEEDAGKNTHPAGADYSLVDLNRAGTPLLEIVSEPDISSAAEAKAYARELWLLMKYAGATDGDLYHGHVRFDVNVSLSKEPGKLGTRTETKNLNSFRSVEAAVNYEIERQTELLQKGEEIVQETRGWDDDKQKTTAQRSKEEAEDYRYMPEPDVPPVVLEEKFIKSIKAQMPALPFELRQKFLAIGLESNIIEDILDRPEIVKALKPLMDVESEHHKRIAFWLLQTDKISAVKVDHLIKLSEMTGEGKLSSTSAKIVFNELMQKDEDPGEIAEKLKLVQVSDSGAIEKIVAEVLAENESAAADVKNGEMKAIGFLVGQVMAKSKGQANPQLAQDLIKQQLGVK